MSKKTKRNEMRRLRHGPRPGEQIPERELRRLHVHCAGNAQDVLSRCREAMEVVLREDQRRWPTVAEWRAKLPAWLVATFRTEEMTDADEERLMKLARKRWPRTVGTFIDWFDPKFREWVWWNASVASPDLLIIDLRVDWTLEYGLHWLLEAAGATQIEEIEGKRRSRSRVRSRVPPAGGMEET